MNQKSIPNDNHVARYCRPATVRNGKLSAAAFFLRESSDTRPEEEYLSVSWIEYFGERDQDVAMTQVRSVVEKNFGTSAKGRYAVLNVGEIVNVGAQSRPVRQLSVLHKPRTGYGCHAGVVGYRAAEKGIAVKLSLLVKPKDILPGLNDE